MILVEYKTKLDLSDFDYSEIWTHNHKSGTKSGHGAIKKKINLLIVFI